jgi:Ni,Fe-hydrogenase III small subunit
MKIHLLSHPMLATEWLSLAGDKYRHLPDIEWELCDSPEDADVLVWDGIVSPKGSLPAEKVQELLKQNKVLLLQGEARTIMASHDYLKLFDTTEIKCVELPGWSELPETLAEALKQCHQKLTHV